MSPSHANKKGVRYRYYVSHALLQNRKANAGSIARVSTPDVEALVYNAVTQKEQSDSKIPDRELLQRHVERVTVHTNTLGDQRQSPIQHITRDVRRNTLPRLRCGQKYRLLRVAYAAVLAMSIYLVTLCPKRNSEQRCAPSRSFHSGRYSLL
jgi:hypothetical protein